MNPMNPTKTAKPDADAMFGQFLADGVTVNEIGRAIGRPGMSDRMVVAYRDGRQLPQGILDGLLKLWAEKYPRKAAPTVG